MTHSRISWLPHVIGIIAIVALACSFSGAPVAWANTDGGHAQASASSLLSGNSNDLAGQTELTVQDTSNGWVQKDGAWTYYQDGTQLKNAWVVTDVHPLDKNKSGLDRYWIEASGKLAVSRFINPKNKRDSNAEWVAYATPTGNVVRGKYITYKGMVLGDNDGRLYTTTRWLTTSYYDGTPQRYRLVKRGVCAVVKTGLFTVGGKKYYGYPGARGYLMRSTTKYISGKWYQANSKGVLKNASEKVRKHIERYVRWAIRIAKDDSHGYSQADRWGPDYDCSSFVCSALRAAKFPKSGASWTGNMKSCLRKIGFVWHSGTKGLKRGDILLVHNSQRQHTEIYLGKKKLVGAHSSENGGIDGETGDQTGGEISITDYYNAPWQGYLRYKG